MYLLLVRAVMICVAPSKKKNCSLLDMLVLHYEEYGILLTR